VKVRELIAELQKLDPELEVVSEYDGLYADGVSLDVMGWDPSAPSPLRRRVPDSTYSEPVLGMWTSLDRAPKDTQRAVRIG